MEAPEKTRTNQKDIDSPQKRIHCIMDTTGTQGEPKYVDLDNLLDSNKGSSKTVKVSFTGEESKTALHEHNSVTSGSSAGDKTPGDRKMANHVTNQANNYNHGDVKATACVKGELSSATAELSEVSNLNENVVDRLQSSLDNPEATAQPTSEMLPQKEDTKNTPTDHEDLQYTDMYLSRKSESDDEVSLVLSDDDVPRTFEDESHYITTHEIQLSELSDHEVDYDIGVGSCWDIEDDNKVYSFVDYASFDGDEAIGGRDCALARMKGNQGQSNSGAAVSTKLESDLCDTDKCASSDESMSKNLNCCGNSAGQIHLSIKTTSRAINAHSNSQEKENIIYCAKHAGDMSRYVFRGADAKAEKLCDSAKCFIAAPGRLHIGNKLKRKDFNEYSSGASTVSELDDADKEVRNLTARAFKSLAYPYFEAINFRTSSESSASEHALGMNRWSTFVDLNYGKINMSQGRDQNTLSHKSSSSSFEIAKNKDNKGYKGLVLANIKPPPNKMFALNGNPPNASSSTKKIELMGDFRQGHSGVITLTETLNFRCNVKSGVSGDERRSKFAQNAVGSRSTDEVTNTLPSGQGSEASKQLCNAGETMEDTHKKAIFASSLLKNVISKKIQFEQERKMERGEICEPYQVPSPCFLHQEPETHKGSARQRESRDSHQQSSTLSEASSDFTIVCVDELGDIVDSGSCDAKNVCRRQDTLTLASETNLESTNEAEFDTKKGAFDAAKSMLLRSQNSAFRSWRDGELEFQKEHKNDKTPEGKPPSSNDNLRETDLQTESGNSKLNKMSHLFVPSIQLASNEREVGVQLPTMNYSTRAPADHGEVGGMQLRSDTLYVADTARSVVTSSKSPEIKINVRSVKDNKSDRFNMSELSTPKIGCNAANRLRAADDNRCQALAAALKGESSEKVPHFMVRDIRDNKAKLQTPIHQVRDVRKLVKSSYHFVSLDSNESKSSVKSDLHSEQHIFKQGPYRNPASLSPIVIKCQSVNTNSNMKHYENLFEASKHRLNEDTCEVDRSSPEGARTGTPLLHRPAGRVPLVNTKRADSSEKPIALKIENKTASQRQEKTPDKGENKPESKMPNQAALKKLQAAVKTMEQLYVFDRNEWKRKIEPHSLIDSHVLSLIANEEYSGPEEDIGNVANILATSNMDKLVRRNSYPNPDKTPPVVTASSSCETTSNREDKDHFKTFHIPISREVRNGQKLPAQQGETAGNKNMPNVSSGQKVSVCATTSNRAKAPQPHAISQTSYSTKGFTLKSPEVPVVKISHPRHPSEERQRTGSEAQRLAQTQPSAAEEPENYLSMPLESHANSGKQAAMSGYEKTAFYPFTATGVKTRPASPPGHTGHNTTRRQEESRQSPKRSSIIMEKRSPDTPTATIYHHSLPMAMSSAQPQVICFSPTMAPPPAMDHFQATQRKMLLDPTTGNYYLVDTPVQPATKRLFDPETGQYVDVPMPQQPMTPVPMPMPMPISPLALSPGAYGHTYMIYPGFMPTPTVIPARTLQSQMSMQSEMMDDGYKSSSHGVQQMDGAYMESPYYMATGTSPQAAQQVPPTRGAYQGFSNGKQPVISITSQQGPRIIAPPSFDGTTMSFVVEHRGDL